jgi:hypothetical protein
MMWRQFSGGQRQPVQTGLSGYQAQRVTPEVSYNDNIMGKLNEFAQNAASLYGTYQQTRSDEVTKTVKDWMANQSVEEYSKAMRDGKVPFQDDPLAMAVLRNKSAYTQSLIIEQDVESKIQSGAFKTVEEADAARIKALNEALPKAAEMFGTSPDDKAFMAGYQRDAERRRDTLLRMQTAVTDKRLRTEAEMQTKVELMAPLEDVLTNFGGEGVAQFVQNSLKNARNTGQVRDSSKALELVANVLDQLPDMKGGYKAIEALGGKEFEFGGKMVPLRDAFGSGKFDLMVAKAQQKELERDANRYASVHGDLTTMAIQGDDAGIVSLRNKMIAESRGMNTPEIQHATTVLEQVRKRNAYLAQQVQAANVEAQETMARQQRAMNTLGGIISGTYDGQWVSARPEDLGLKNAKELSQVEQSTLSNLPEGPQRDAAVLRLAATIPNGFAASALKGAVKTADADWQIYLNQVSNGKQDVAVPNSVSRVAALAELDETSLLASGDKPSFLSAIQAGKRLNIAPADVAVAEAAWKKLPEKERTTQMKALDGRLGKIDMPLTTNNRESIKALAGHYLALGLDADSAVRRAGDDFKAQAVIVGDRNVVPKAFFTVDGSKNSVEQGTQLFQTELKSTAEALGVKDKSDLLMTYDNDKQAVTVRNLRTGEARQIAKSDLRQKYSEGLKAATEKNTKAANDTLTKEAAKAKASQGPQRVTANPFINITIGDDGITYQ